MNNIFQKKELKKPSFFQKLLKKEPKENSLIMLNNLLASKDILEISKSEIEHIERTHGISLIRDYKNEILVIYEAIVSNLTKNLELNEREINILNHFASLLGLPDSLKNQSFEKVVRVLLKEGISSLIVNHELPNNYDILLKQYQGNLDVSEELVESISKEVRVETLQNLFASITENQRVSPEEDTQLKNSAKSLQIEFKLDDKSAKKFEKMKNYWSIENEELVPLDCDLSLQKKENCYQELSVVWKEKRKVTKRINYAGPTAKIKIMKGVHYRIGSAQIQRVTNEELVEVDKGKLYITSKRLIFVGSKKNTNILYSKILSFIPYKDGIEIVKDSGRNPLFQCSNLSEETLLILNRLINA